MIIDLGHAGRSAIGATVARKEPFQISRRQVLTRVNLSAGLEAPDAEVAVFCIGRERRRPFEIGQGEDRGGA